MQRYFILFMVIVVGLIFASFALKGFLRRMSGRRPEDK